MSLTLIVKNFFQKHREDRPFLLGLSGGEDSSCLFHLLCKAKVPFGAVYIDHGWRQESKDEAKGLKALCESAKIPFHQEQIAYGEKAGNLEDYCRRMRLKIYHLLCLNHEYAGVILGHHALDLAETVLKRIFEGASLLKFKGMEPFSENAGLKIFRPLLAVPKEAIKKFVEEHQIPFFQDISNEDQRFLRARMRKELFPHVQKSFGKNIEMPLVRLSLESAIMHDFLEKRTAPLLALAKWDPFELDLSSKDLHEAEARHILMRVAKMLNIKLSNSGLQDASLHLLKKGSCKTFQQLQIAKGLIKTLPR